MTKEEIEICIESLEDDIKKSERRKGLYARKTFAYKFYSNQLECLLKESEALQKQLKEMENTQSTQDEIPTKSELLAAGAKGKYNENYRYIFSIEGDVVNEVIIDLASPSIYLDCLGAKDYQTLTLKPTKKNLNDVHVMFTGKPLDFTVKEKDYSWSAVYERIEEQGPIIKALDQIGLNTGIPEPLRKKLIALLKLHYIIEELYRDFEGAIGQRGWVYWSVSNNQLESDCSSQFFIGESIRTQCIEASRKLIETHPQLLKDALGIVETEK